MASILRSAVEEAVDVVRGVHDRTDRSRDCSGPNTRSSIVNVLGQKHLSNAIERDGKPVHDPQGAIFGPKAMIINQSAGSGGDAMPCYFRKAGVGTLVGTRTWGGCSASEDTPRSSTAASSQRRAMPFTACRGTGKSRATASRRTCKSRICPRMRPPGTTRN